MKYVYNSKTKTGEYVEFEPIPPTEEELKQERINVIHQELEELDKIVNRATEDTIEELNRRYGYVPYQTIADAINTKIELRDELMELGD